MPFDAERGGFDPSGFEKLKFWLSSQLVLSRSIYSTLGPKMRIPAEAATQCMLDSREISCIGHTSWFTGTGVS